MPTGSPSQQPNNAQAATPTGGESVPISPIEAVANSPLTDGATAITATPVSTLYSSVINGRSQVVNKTKITVSEKTTIPFQKESDLIDQSERWTPTISDTPGRGTFLIYDATTNKKIAKKADMIIQTISWQRREAQSIIKNIKGFTFQAIDSHPLIVTIGGYLINSRDDEADRRESETPTGRMTHTHWFIQFLKDYEKIAASKAIENNYRILFSVEDFTAQVHILNQQGTLTSQYSDIGNFSMTLLVLRQTYRGVLELQEKDLGKSELESSATITGDVNKAELSPQITTAISGSRTITMFTDHRSPGPLSDMARSMMAQGDL
jgi:hypothetical protein